jgi:hypothetical protein
VASYFLLHIGMDADELVIIDDDLVMSVEDHHAKLPIQGSADTKTRIQNVILRSSASDNVQVANERPVASEILTPTDKIPALQHLETDFAPASRNEIYSECCNGAMTSGSSNLKLAGRMLLQEHTQYAPAPPTALPAFRLPHRGRLETIRASISCPKPYEVVSPLRPIFNNDLMRTYSLLRRHRL